jgi:hypothetical protein
VARTWALAIAAPEREKEVNIVANCRADTQHSVASGLAFVVWLCLRAQCPCANQSKQGQCATLQLTFARLRSASARGPPAQLSLSLSLRFSKAAQLAMFFAGARRVATGRAFAGAATLGAVAASTFHAARAEPSLTELEKRMGSIESALKGPSAADVEAKFTTFWPRKIMILFGPPCVGIALCL